MDALKPILGPIKEVGDFLKVWEILNKVFCNST